MMEANLVEKKHLNCLELFWNRCDPKQNYMATVERLQPPTNLIELKTINYPCTHFPNWMVEDRIVRKFRRVHIENSPLVVLPSLGHLPFLEILILKNLKSIKKINYDFYGSNSEVTFPSLKELVLCHLDEWEEWCGSKGMQTFPHLRKLHLECCPKLKDVPVDSFNNSVVELYIVSCAEIFKKSETILKQMTALTHLTIRAALGSPRVASRCFEYLRSLEALYLENAEIDMVEGMEHLKMLKKLQLSRVTFTLLQTEQSNNEIHQNQETGLKLLTYLGLQCMDSQKLLTLGRLSSLRTLLIYHSFTEEFVLGQIPWFAQQTSIEELEFVYCNDLVCIPSIISILVSLKKLTIRSCRYIKAITNPLPQNLKELHIINCSQNLMERCLPEMGKDWPNISHIPCIRVVKTTDQSRISDVLPELH
ncbi:hypothetical protein LUZ60_009057 [Juncus effusus]|nr:hypothetical protein LUZ60_009057 [Juncus effusus]